MSQGSRTLHRCCFPCFFARLVNSRRQCWAAARRGIGVAGIVGVGHLAALQRKTWLVEGFRGCAQYRRGAGTGLWVVRGSSQARAIRFNRKLRARMYYAGSVSRTTDNAEGRQARYTVREVGINREGRARSWRNEVAGRWKRCGGSELLARSLAACCCVRFLAGGCGPRRKSLAVSWLAGWQGESRVLRRQQGSGATNRGRLPRLLQGQARWWQARARRKARSSAEAMASAVALTCAHSLSRLWPGW